MSGPAGLRARSCARPRDSWGRNTQRCHPRRPFLPSVPSLRSQRIYVYLLLLLLIYWGSPPPPIYLACGNKADGDSCGVHHAFEWPQFPQGTWRRVWVAELGFESWGSRGRSCSLMAPGRPPCHSLSMPVLPPSHHRFGSGTWLPSDESPQAVHVSPSSFGSSPRPGPVLSPAPLVAPPPKLMSPPESHTERAGRE